MRFLSRFQTEGLANRLRRQVNNPKEPIEFIHLLGDKWTPAAIAHLVVASLGDFSEATYLFLQCPWGEGADTDLSWSEFRKWRAELGERRRLYDAPGQVFERGEADGLSRLLEFSLNLGWDGLLAAKPGRHLMFFSHDDFIEVYSGRGAGRLARELAALVEGKRRR